MIFGNQYEPFVIPCKPTSPQIKVELVNQEGEVMQNYSMCDQKNGFMVIINEIGEGFVSCRVFNRSNQNIFIFYNVHSRMSKNVPIIFNFRKYYNQKYDIYQIFNQTYSHIKLDRERGEALVDLK